ncbi:MAG: prephenate dehydrogenase/arogenate dehydrogenase family protein [Pseudomonadota bacterium]
MIDRLCVIGVGLIGGSIARAARERGLCREIIGAGREEDAENLCKALSLGVVDIFSVDLAEASETADYVVISVPVGENESVFRALRPAWSDRTVYTDVGSTKVSVVEAAKRVFGEVPANFVPAHPIAGAETSGVEAALADLYQDKRLILTPLAHTSSAALRAVSGFWQAIGCTVSEMTVEHHDAVLAATSHLPHVVAYALVDMLGKKDEKDEILQYAAGGFRDFTRIASSDPKMWLDICVANRNEIIDLLRQFINELNGMSSMLETGADRDLYETFCYAKNARQRFLDQFEK